MKRLSLFLLVFLICCAACAELTDFTFAIWSDPHFADTGGSYRDACAQAIVELPGTPYPPQIGGTVGPIKFVLMTGDITENSLFEQYQDNDGQTNDDFISSINYWFTSRGIPVYEITGNHDSYNEPGRTQIRQAITTRHGGSSYSFDYGGVHFVGLDGWTGAPDRLSASAVDYLEAHMPTLNTRQAVILFNHYPPPDTSDAQWERVYNAISGYNVILMCEGHEHYPRVGQWRGFDYFVTSDSKVIHGNQAFTVVRVTDTQLTAIARDWATNTWRTDAMIQKPITGVGLGFSQKLANPSFEDNGGSLDGWQVFRVPGREGPDTPPLDNTNRYLVRTQFGEHFAGKVTSWLLADFTMGQVLEVPNAVFGVDHVNWRLSAYVQLHSRGGDIPYPANVHQVWEIGWKNDGSPPVNINDCDVYQTIAAIDGSFTGNDPTGFHLLSARGSITGVPNLRYVAFRIRMYNDSQREWSLMNIDNVDLALIPQLGPSTIALLKGMPDGTVVNLTGKVVSVGRDKFANTAYIQDLDRTSGIKVYGSTIGSDVVKGAVVNVTGTLSTSNGERLIISPTTTVVGTGWDVIPIALTSRDLGGGGLGEYIPGITGASGLHNIGLLVTIFGRVGYRDSGMFYVDDGSGLDDGTGRGAGVQVLLSGLASGNTITAPAQNSFVKVTGISTCRLSGGKIIRVLRPRDQADIVEYP